MSDERQRGIRRRDDERGEDGVTVRDATERRRFMRAGAAVLLAGGAGSLARPVLAADCDRAVGGEPGGKKPKQATSGSDSDAGAGADPAGCGRRRDDAPKISRAAPEGGPVSVATVRATG